MIDDPVTKAFLYMLGLFIFMFNLIKVILMPTKRELKSITASFAVGFPMGCLFGLLAYELQAGNMVSIVIGCFTVLLAERIAMAIMQVDLQAGVQRAVDNLIDKHTK